MKKPAIPPNEAERLRILESLAIVYSPAEERFDRITRLACRLFDVPIALVSLVAEDRQWFKSADGLSVAETPRDISFCAHAILRDRTFVVNDAHKDPDFADNPLVTGAPHVRFYAGHPLRVHGEPVGTLCVIDHEPREFSADDLESLQSLGALIEAELRASALDEVQQQMLEQRAQIDREQLIDPVTQCWNSEALKQMMPREIALSARKKDRYSYFHLQLMPDPREIEGIAEEEIALILREAARRLKKSLRAYDLVARIGPARFAIYAPACNSEVSELLAERIAARIADVPFDTTPPQVIDVKVGIASAQSDENVTPSRLTKVADLALEDAIESLTNHVRLMI